MTPGKHDPASLQSYFNAHDGHMRSLERSGVVVRDGLEVAEFTGFYVMAGDIEIQGGAVVTVEKQIDVVDTAGDRERVQTTYYSYNVRLPGIGTIFRYDSPHQHRPYHHVHRYDVLNRDSEGEIHRLDDDDHVPTLAEVIREAHDWCGLNHQALETLGGDQPKKLDAE